MDGAAEEGVPDVAEKEERDAGSGQLTPATNVAWRLIKRAFETVGPGVLALGAVDGRRDGPGDRAACS